MSCNGGRVFAKEGSLSNIGYCNTCPAAQKLSVSRNAQRAAKLVIAEGTTGTTISIRAYREIVKDIADTDDISTETLLTSTPFSVFYSRSNVIAKVCRQKP